jgi:hypothetical protein
MLAELRPLSQHQTDESVRESLKRLLNITVTVEYRSSRPGRRTTRSHLLEFIETRDADSSNSSVRYRIPKELRLVMVPLHQDGAFWSGLL